MAYSDQGSFETEFKQVQWLKGKLSKGMACTEPLNSSEPPENCKPEDVIAIGEWNGIIRQLALAANINYTKANFKTKRLLFELSLMVTRDATDGIATRRKEKMGNTRIANDVRKNDVLGVREDNFDKVIAKFTIDTAWVKSTDTTSTKFESEKRRVTTILWVMKSTSEISSWRDRITMFWNPLDPKFARVIQDNKTFIFDEPSGTSGHRTRNVYQLNKEGGVIGGVQVEEWTNKVRPISWSLSFHITFQPFTIDTK